MLIISIVSKNSKSDVNVFFTVYFLPFSFQMILMQAHYPVYCFMWKFFIECYINIKDIVLWRQPFFLIEPP